MDVIKRLIVHGLVLLALFAAVFWIHATSRVVETGDSRWTLHQAMSLIKEGNLDLNEYAHLMDEHGGYTVEVINGNYFGTFPIGTALLSVPYVYFVERLWDPDLATLLNAGMSGRLQIPLASVFVTLCAVMIYLIGRKSLSHQIDSILLVFIFAFCTPAWSTASRALWQHGPSMMFLSMTLYIFLWAEEKPWASQFAAIPLAMSYIIRPTNSLSIVVFGLLVVIRYRRYFLGYCFWGLLISLPWLLDNLSVYSALFPPYYQPSRLAFDLNKLIHVMAANLISPGRGLFIFTPVFVFSLVGLGIKIYRRHIKALDWAVTMILILHLIAISSFPHWWGGHSFGPRFLTDMVPYLVYFLIPVIEEIRQMSKWKKMVGAVIFGLTILFSFFVHYQGATNPRTQEWNYIPKSIDAAPERNWDWKDLQFLR